MLTLEVVVSGRTLISPCAISAAHNPDAPSPKPISADFQAIWDTGAAGSVISQRVIDRCALQPSGVMQVKGVHGPATERNKYLVNITLNNGTVRFVAFEITHGDLDGFDVLIGMDVIGLGDFSVTNANGFTMFSYRAPSQTHVDYVAKHTADTQRENMLNHGGKKNRKYKHKSFGKNKH